MNGHMKDWIMGIAGTLLVALIVWQSGTINDLGKTIIEVKARQDLAEKVISAPVEAAFAELRDKTNQQAEACSKIGAAVTANAMEIGYIKERVTKAETKFETRP